MPTLPHPVRDENLWIVFPTARARTVLLHFSTTSFERTDCYGMNCTPTDVTLAQRNYVQPWTVVTRVLHHFPRMLLYRTRRGSALSVVVFAAFSFVLDGRRFPRLKVPVLPRLKVPTEVLSLR